MLFEEASKHLKRLGIRVTQRKDYRPPPDDPKGLRDPVPLPIYEYFVPPFTAKDWRRIGQRDGDHYVGGCCGQTSAIQDIIEKWFRDGDFARIQDLSEMAEMWNRHDGEGSWFKNLRMPIEEITKKTEQWANPWFRLAVVWHLVQDCFDSKVENGIRTDMSPADRAICTIDRIASALSMHRVFGGGFDNDQMTVNKLLILARFAPALRYVLNHIDAYAGGPTTVTGWAMVDLEKGEDVICENGFGYCVFSDRAELNRVLALWAKNENAHEGHVPAYTKFKDRIGIRPVAIDLGCEDGPKFTGPVERITEIPVSPPEDDG